MSKSTIDRRGGWSKITPVPQEAEMNTYGDRYLAFDSCRGQDLLKPNWRLRFYLSLVTLYALAAFGLAGWMAVTGPALEPGTRVLMTRDIKVDQFYSGLALSAILAPAAVIMRKMSNDISVLHPLAMATRIPIRIGDLDRMMDPGPLAIKATLNYSIWHATVQAVLMLSGALLVPVGTLLLTTGEYAAPTPGYGLVGLPTSSIGIANISSEMAAPIVNSTRPWELSYGDEKDNFIILVSEESKSTIIQEFALLTEPPNYLGPVPTKNFTYGAGVTYKGVIGYQWKSGCQPTDAIQYSLASLGGDNFNITYTFPDGSQNITDTSLPLLFMWSDSNMKGSGGIPAGGTTYFALAGQRGQAVEAPPDTAGLDYVNTTWISRVKCKPALKWLVSSCLWNGTIMTSCTPTPGQNTTELDVDGLNMLEGYMSATLWKIYNDSIGSLAEYVFGNSIISISLTNFAGATVSYQYRIPSIGDYTNLYGLVAQSITAVTSNGYYGIAVVPTVEQSPKLVYVMRTYILAIVIVIFSAVPLFTILDLIYHSKKEMPLRRASFLTISNAVRGPWWDRELFGGCCMDQEDLRSRHWKKVMYGVDGMTTQHVGLAMNVYEIERGVTYYGAREARGSTETNHEHYE